MDCRRRFLESYTETVLGLDPGPFARAAELIASEGVTDDRELDSEALERLAGGATGADRGSRRRLARGCDGATRQRGEAIPVG
jgi:pyruvate,orthophosphate dikinase